MSRTERPTRSTVICSHFSNMEENGGVQNRVRAPLGVSIHPQTATATDLLRTLRQQQRGGTALGARRTITNVDPPRAAGRAAWRPLHALRWCWVLGDVHVTLPVASSNVTAQPLLLRAAGSETSTAAGARVCAPSSRVHMRRLAGSVRPLSRCSRLCVPVATVAGSAGQRLFMEDDVWDASATRCCAVARQVCDAALFQIRVLGKAVLVELSVPADKLLTLVGHRGALGQFSASRTRLRRCTRWGWDRLHGDSFAGCAELVSAWTECFGVSLSHGGNLCACCFGAWVVIVCAGCSLFGCGLRGYVGVWRLLLAFGWCGSGRYRTCPTAVVLVRDMYVSIRGHVRLLATVQE